MKLNKEPYRYVKALLNSIYFSERRGENDQVNILSFNKLDVDSQDMVTVNWR